MAKAGEKVLVLRTCDKDRKSHGGFQWPGSGPVECADWNPKAECGNGLHGLLWGEGDASLMNWEVEAVWLVVEVDAGDVVQIGNKVKFPRGVVVACGDRRTATDYLVARAPGKKVHGGTATAGYSGTATAGYSGTATAGYSGTATAGDIGTATAGDIGTATAGYRGTATAGDIGTATAGYRGTATAGDRGTATAGDRGTATAGDSGTATAKKIGFALASVDGKARADENGTIAVRWYDEANSRYRLCIGYVGENGIEPNVFYRVKDGSLFKCED